MKFKGERDRDKERHREGDREREKSLQSAESIESVFYPISRLVIIILLR